MKKNRVLLAAVGLAVLTGCDTPKVMDNRQYIASKDDPQGMTDIEAPAQDPQNAPVSTPGQEPAPAPVPAPAPASRTVFAPMEGVTSSGGITSSGRRSSRRSARPAAAAKGGYYIVKAGDYPGKIARKFRISVKALMAANNMTEQDVKRLQIGRKLIIPGGKAVRTGETVKGRRNTTPVTAEKGVYIVKAGDFPEKIARRHKVKLSALLKANNLTMASSRNLKIGQKLIIPGAGTSEMPAPGEKTQEIPAPVPVAPAQDKAPETPEKPAENPQLQSAKNLADDLEKSMPAEDTSSAPAGGNDAGDLAVISEDTTLQALAEKYKTTVDHLRSLNEGFSGDTVKKGTYFFVPKAK